MAGLILTATFAPINTGVSDITLIMVKAPTNQRLKIRGWGISFAGQDNLGKPIECQLIRVSSDGTGSAVTVVKQDDDASETIQSTASEAYGGSNEPSSGDVLRRRYVHPQTGWEYIVAEPEELIVKGGNRIALKAIAPPAAVSCSGYIDFEE